MCKRDLLEQFHPNNSRYYEILNQIGKLHEAKGKDYDGSEQYGNIRKSAKDWGIPTWVAALIRASDKMARLQSLYKKGDLANESAIDSFNDGANYFIIARVLYEEEQTDKYEKQLDKLDKQDAKITSQPGLFGSARGIA